MGGDGGVYLRLLGQCTLTRNGRDVDLRTRRTLAVLTFLACEDRTIDRETLAATFWPDAPTPTALGNLRVILSNLRRDAPGLLHIERRTVGLAPGSAARVDVLQFDRVAEGGLALARTGTPDAVQHLKRAYALYDGPLAPGLDTAISDRFEEWLGEARARRHMCAVRVLGALIDEELANGPTEETHLLAQDLVALDALAEGSQTRLMRTLWALGERAAALRSYQEWAERLAQELGVQPTNEVDALARAIGRAGVAPQVPLWADEGLPPRPLLVGRSHDVAVLRKKMEGDERIITVTGPAGVGKTTTMVEVAHLFRQESPDPVIHVDLTTVSSRSELIGAVLTACGEHRATSLDVRDLHRRLDGQQLLLVLDNFEHLLGERDIVASLPRHCPGVVTVVTSRQPLRLGGEVVHELAPLTLPPPVWVEPTEPMASDAVRLFLARADRVGHRIEPTSANLSKVAAICTTVDGLPLGIELAAARLPVLGLTGVAGALVDGEVQRLDVLGAGPADAPRKGRSAQEALEWSYSRLSQPAQSLFRRLGTFDGSFDLTAVDRVCAGDDLPKTAVLDALSELVDVHLVERTSRGSSRARFRLLITMRAFARRRLEEEGAIKAMAARCARYYIEEVRVFASATADRTAAESIARFHADLPNIAASLDWCHATGDRGAALEMLATLGPFWRLGSAPSTGLTMLDRALTDARGEVEGMSSAAPAECRIWRASLVAEQHGYRSADEVRSALGEAVPVVLAHGVPGWRERCLAEAVHAAVVVGEAELAGVLTRQVTDIADTDMGQWWALAARWESSVVLMHRSDDAGVRRMLADLIADSRSLGHRRIELYAWMWADILGADRRDLAETPPPLEQLLDMAVEAGDRRCQIWILVSLGTRTVFAGDLAGAAARFDEAMGLARRVDYRHGMGFALMGLVGVAGFGGDLHVAARYHGALVAELDTLRNVMPREYHDAYQQVAAAVSVEESLAGDVAEGRRAAFMDSVASGHRELRARAH